MDKKHEKFRRDLLEQADKAANKTLLIWGCVGAALAVSVFVLVWL